MAQFQTLHTTYGLAAMAAAEATGTQILIAHIAVGDGNGNATTPAESQTTLVREVFRAAPNSIYQDPEIPNRFTAELVIPASEGGFVMREVGVFDSTGSLFVVGNLPPTYKPTPTEGAFADTVVRVEFMVSNADVVTIQVNPNIVAATRQWVLNTITACHIVPGGTTGQVLRKASNGCGDTEWADPTDVNVIVEAIEEEQTLAAAQTVVTWATVTTEGLAVYIEGVRIPRGAGVDKWQIDPANPETKIILGKSYPDGTKILGVQNDPLGADFPLIRDQNFADVPNKATARTNLDVFSRSESRQLAPPGLIGHFARNTAPAGWLKANGAAISRTVYADLFAAIGTTFGAGDGFNTFNLPDLRGEFVRGWDDGRGVDASRTLGSAQKGTLVGWDQANDSMWGISTTAVGSVTRQVVGADGYLTADYAGAQLRSVDGSDDSQALPGPETGSKGYSGVTRPRNVALLACIKF